MTIVRFGHCTLVIRHTVDERLNYCESWQSQIGVSSPVKRSAVTQEIELETQPSLISQADSPHKVKRQRLADPDPPSVATVMNEADHPPANAGIAPPAQVVETGKEEAKTEGSGSATTDTASLSPMELDSASPVQGGLCFYSRCHSAYATLLTCSVYMSHRHS